MEVFEDVVACLLGSKPRLKVRYLSIYFSTSPPSVYIARGKPFSDSKVKIGVGSELQIYIAII